MTISGLTMGILLTASMVCLSFRFIPKIPTAARVPITVATAAASTATISVILKESMMSEFWNREAYHLAVKPCHTTRLLESLKEKRSGPQ